MHVSENGYKFKFPSLLSWIALTIIRYSSHSCTLTTKPVQLQHLHPIPSPRTEPNQPPSTTPNTMFLTTALLLASTALAAPLAPLHTLLARDSHHCDLSAVHLTLPSEPELTVPDGQTLQVAAVAVGVQNYTCTDGLWVASGALAE